MGGIVARPGGAGGASPGGMGGRPGGAGGASPGGIGGMGGSPGGMGGFSSVISLPLHRKGATSSWTHDEHITILQG